MVERSLEFLGIALAAAMAARAFTRERLPFALAARLRLWMQDKMMFLSSGENRRKAALFGELYHLLTCPLCVSFWIVGVVLVLLNQWSIINWMSVSGAAWILGRAMGWENYPDNEV